MSATGAFKPLEYVAIRSVGALCMILSGRDVTSEDDGSGRVCSWPERPDYRDQMPRPQDDCPDIHFYQLFKNQLPYPCKVLIHSLTCSDRSHSHAKSPFRPVGSGASCDINPRTIMFSAFASTDSSALDDGTCLFDQSNNDLLSLPLSNDSIHLKGNIAPIPGLSNMGYGRESPASSVHYGDSHDTSDMSADHASGRDERETSTSTAFVNGYAPRYTPSPLQYPITPHLAAGENVNGIQDKPKSYSNGNIVHKIADQSITPHGRYQLLKEPLLKDPQGTHTFMARTPQSLSRDSQPSSTPELGQVQEKPTKHRRVNSNSAKGKTAELRASSSIPGDLSWPEFGRQCILAAENSRLNPFALHPAEYKLLRSHINHSQVTIYLNIRNAILRLWHRNPLVYVSAEEAAGCTRDKRYFALANVAYLWLLRNGYINFGCVEVPDTANPIPRNKVKAARRTIIVVGAGMSGLGCARHLQGIFAQLGDEFASHGERPPKIIVLEARPRVGGRVYSHPFRNQSGSTLPPGHRCTAEMGAQIVTGFEHGNPLNAIIRGQLGIPYHGLRDNTILYDYDGTVVERTQDALVEKLYNDVLERASAYRNKPAAQRTVEGDRNLILFGREPIDSAGPSIAELEQSSAPLSANDQSTASTTEEKPTSGVEKLAGRAYQLSGGFNANITASEAVQGMGWALKAGASTGQTLDLDTIAHASEFPTLGQTMDEGLRQYQALVDMKPRDMRLLNWHHANLEYANAVSVNQLSLSGWDQDIGNEFEGQHSEVIGGYQQVPRGLWQAPSQLDVRFKTPIRAIHYDPEEQRVGKAVRIECTNGEVFEADKVVVTTPLGVLKSGSISFQPALPDWKQGVIERMGFGLLNKVSQQATGRCMRFANRNGRSSSCTRRHSGKPTVTCLACSTRLKTKPVCDRKITRQSADDSTCSGTVSRQVASLCWWLSWQAILRIMQKLLATISSSKRSPTVSIPCSRRTMCLCHPKRSSHGGKTTHMLEAATRTLGQRRRQATTT